MMLFLLVRNHNGEKYENFIFSYRYFAVSNAYAAQSTFACELGWAAPKYPDGLATLDFERKEAAIVTNGRSNDAKLFQDQYFYTSLEHVNGLNIPLTSCAVVDGSKPGRLEISYKCKNLSIPDYSKAEKHPHQSGSRTEARHSPRAGSITS